MPPLLLDMGNLISLSQAHMVSSESSRPVTQILTTLQRWNCNQTVVVWSSSNQSLTGLRPACLVDRHVGSRVGTQWDSVGQRVQ